MNKIPLNQTNVTVKFWYQQLRTLFAGEGKESGVSPSGEGVCYKSRDAFVQPAFFLAEKSRKKWRSCRRVQKHVYFNYFIA